MKHLIIALSLLSGFGLNAVFAETPAPKPLPIYSDTDNNNPKTKVIVPDADKPAPKLAE